jgi:hypothetical protein
MMSQTSSEGAMTRIRLGLLAALLCGSVPAVAAPPLMQATGLNTALRCVMRDPTHIAIVNSTSGTIPAGRQIVYETVRVPDGAAVRGTHVGGSLSPGSLVQLEVGESASCRAWLPTERAP